MRRAPASFEQKFVKRQRGEIFVARGVPVERLEITEGKLLVAAPDKLEPLEPRLSPTGKAGLKVFLELKQI